MLFFRAHLIRSRHGYLFRVRRKLQICSCTLYSLVSSVIYGSKLLTVVADRSSPADCPQLGL